MPQFDPSWFIPQLFWLAVIFAGLLLAMYKFAVPAVGETLAKRRERIEGDLARAQDLKVEIEAAAAAYEKTLADARAEAHHLLVQAQQRMADAAAERHRVVAAAIQQQVTAAETRILDAKNHALADVRGETIDTARAAVERLLGGSVDASTITAAVDEVLASRPAGQGGHA